MPLKDDPDRLLYPGFTNRVMVDTWRGVVRVRKWPDKRGRPKSAAVRAQNDWFRDANRLASRAPGAQVSTAIEITKGSGLYPRDILLRMMAGNLGPIILPNGDTLTKATKRIEPVLYQGTTLQLTANFPLLANTLTPITWPLPVIDKLGMWSPGAPTLLTIPAGVKTVQLFGTLDSIAANVHTCFHQIHMNGALIVLISNTGVNANAVPISTPAVPVVAGDTFSLQAFTSLASNLQALPITSFTLNVLEAE